MKHFLHILLLILLALPAFSQQRTLWSQHIFNDFVINPAIAGAKDYVPLHIAVRRQWMGIKDAPVSQAISGHGNLGYNLGIGGLIINEVSGPSRRTGLDISLAYHLRLTQGSKHHGPAKILSFGMAASLSQFKIDVTKLTTYVPGDNGINDGYTNDLLPDMSLGMYYHDGNRYYAGFSVHNIVESKTDLYSIISDVTNPLERTYYLMGGYNWVASDMLTMQPSLLFRMIDATPIQFDFQYRFLYKNKHWFTLGYRHLDAVIVGAGFQVNVFRFGYSYDVVLSAIRQHSSGSHEIALTIMLFDDHIKSIGRPGDRIYRNREFKPVIRDF